MLIMFFIVKFILILFNTLVYKHIEVLKNFGTFIGKIITFHDLFIEKLILLKNFDPCSKRKYINNNNTISMKKSAQKFLKHFNLFFV